MIFDIPTLIETCSRGITLYPGDVIATGTPAGVGMGFEPPSWLGPGDVVRIEIDGIGAIENRVRVALSAATTMALHLIDKIAVEDEGEGDAVVCVHGLGGSSNTWTPLMPALARHRVDPHRPAGQRPLARASRAPLSIERLVDALLSVCARLGVARAHWLGHSMGTIVCQHLAVAQPKLVRSLALFGPLIAPPEPARAGDPRARAPRRATKARPACTRSRWRW